MTLAELIEAGCELAPGQRVELANELLASIEPGDDTSQAAVDAAWSAEIGNRLDGLLTGKVETVSFSQTYAKLSAKIAAARR